MQTLEKGLAKLKLHTSDIDMVILTHLHWDHVGLAQRFANATFVVQKEELDFALNPHPAVPYYNRDLFEHLNFEVVDGDCQITDGIKVFLTPGHSPGGQTVSIATEKGAALITGFCSIQENFEPSEEISKKMPIIVPGIHLDIMQSYDSMLKVKRFADIIIPIHEPKFALMDKIP